MGILSLHFLKQYKLKYNKIASAMIIDKKFLDAVAKQGRHTFISTGMSNFKIIDEAVQIFKKNKCSFELMHCISKYPFDDSIANLNMINVLKKRYNCNVGYSGHEKGGLAISYAASALGISSLERHFTLDRNMYGTDQTASITPPTLKQLIGGIRKIEVALEGSKDKVILEIGTSLGYSTKILSGLFKKVISSILIFFNKDSKRLNASFLNSSRGSF